MIKKTKKNLCHPLELCTILDALPMITKIQKRFEFNEVRTKFQTSEFVKKILDLLGLNTFFLLLLMSSLHNNNNRWHHFPVKILYQIFADLIFYLIRKLFLHEKVSYLETCNIYFYYS